MFDARYRDFPIELFAVPVLGFFLLAIADIGIAMPRQDDDIEERLLATAIALAAPLIVWNEGLANRHALAWAGLCWMLAAAVALARRRRAPSEHKHAEQQGYR